MPRDKQARELSATILQYMPRAIALPRQPKSRRERHLHACARFATKSYSGPRHPRHLRDESSPTPVRATQGCWAEFRVAPAGAAPARNMECSGERGVCDKDEGYRSSKDVVKNIRARTEGRYLERPDTCTVQHTKHDCCSRSGRVASAWTCVLHAASSEPT